MPETPPTARNPRREGTAEVLRRHNVTLSGPPNGRPLVFAHGFGCDQNMWRPMASAFDDRFRVVLFDHLGAGRSDLSAWSPERHATLDGYAADLNAIGDALNLRDAVLVGHSVSAMIGALAAIAAPERFSALVMVSPSPRYLDDADYRGGFSRDAIHELLESLESNYLGWSSVMAPAIMGNPERPELAGALLNSFCRTDPDIAAHFARTTFLADNRADLLRITVPTLVLQCREDAIAPVSVGEYVAGRIPRARMVLLDATGHCPHLSAPAATIAAVAEFVG